MVHLRYRFRHEKWARRIDVVLPTTWGELKQDIALQIGLKKVVKGHLVMSRDHVACHKQCDGTIRELSDQDEIQGGDLLILSRRPTVPRAPRITANDWLAQQASQNEERLLSEATKTSRPAPKIDLHNPHSVIYSGRS